MVFMLEMIILHTHVYTIAKLLVVILVLHTYTNRTIITDFYDRIVHLSLHIAI